MPALSPFLWFDHEAEEAARFYVSVFPDSELLEVTRYPEGSPMPAGAVMAASFRIEGIEFQALNGGPGHPLTDAISFVVSAPTQADIDRYWDLLTSDGGRPGPCGWLTDKFGLSWQVVPPVLRELTTDPDPVVAGRVMQAMLSMGKIDISGLEAARDAA